MKLRQARDGGLAIVACLIALLAGPGAAQAGDVPEGFEDTVALGGLSEPISVRFADDGRVFVAEKSGLIKVFDDLSDPTSTTFADLRTNVYSLWDRGLLGFELAPNFPADPYVYVLYAHDAAIGGTAPRWGTAGGSTDDCPVPEVGCVISGRLSRLRAAGNVMTGTEQVLVEDWCQQYSSHSVGDIAFGADGALYASGGEGASFNFADYGQSGNPLNPCGDPPTGVGGLQTPPSAEGGALRAQDIRSQVTAPPPPSPPVLLRPNTDITSQWTVAGGSGAAWDALNDSLAQPAAVPVESFMYSGVQNQVTEVGLTTHNLGGTAPTAGKAWFFGNVPTNGAVKVDVIWGGSVRATTTVQGGASGAPYDWRSIDVTPPNQTAVDDLRLRFTVTAGTSNAGNQFAAYFELQPAAAAPPPPTPSGQTALRPNADVTSQWVVGGGGPAWDALDDAVTQPSSVPVEKFIYEGVVNKVTEVALTTQALGTATPTSGTAWFFNNVPANGAVRVDVVWGGQVRASTTMSGGSTGAGYQWRSVEVTPPNQVAVDDLRLRFTVTSGTPGSSNLFATYFDLEWADGSGGGGGGGGAGLDPTGLNGSVIRVDPATGAGLSDNPHASSADPNERRIVAYGFRNPFRIEVRPGTSDLWVGDVGWGLLDEINRVPDPTVGPADNFGWPCYEGPGRQPGYDSADLTLCESLYASPNLTPSYFTYTHGVPVVPGESCSSGSTTTTGLAFYGAGSFPSQYDGALFFADYARDCIWAMQAGSNGLPDPSSIETFDAGAANPVDVLVGPDGDLYYVDLEGGAVRRISFTGENGAPTAVAEANPISGPTPLAVDFDATASSDPDAADTLTYEWDLDGDGQYDDSTAAQPSRTYAVPGVVVVGLRVTDPGGQIGLASVTIHPGNTPPVANITSPAEGTLWRVGQARSFAGTGTDAEDGALAAPRFSWQLNMEHCPSDCHTHPMSTYPGVVGGSFVAPDHEYPSHLELRLTVTDSGGLTDTDQLRLDPRTVSLTMKSSNPTGLQLTLGSSTATANFSRTVIQNSVNSISAPTPQVKNGITYNWLRWSDSGARTHNITATANRTFTAYFQAQGAGTNSATGGGASARARAKCKRRNRARVKAGKKPRRCKKRGRARG